MNLRFLSDDQLLVDTQNLVQREREVLAEILHHLREIEFRKLYCTLGHGSLFDYAVSHLKYSEAQAYRRISAMRLLTQIPTLEEKVQTGELTLTQINVADQFFQRARKEGRPLSVDEKRETLESLIGLSSRESERKIQEILPEITIKHDVARETGHGEVDFSFRAPIELRQELEELKGWLAHQMPQATMADLIRWSVQAGKEKSLREKHLLLSRKQRINSTFGGEGDLSISENLEKRVRAAVEMSEERSADLQSRNYVGVHLDSSETEKSRETSPPAEVDLLSSLNPRAKNQKVTEAAAAKCGTAIPAATRREIWWREDGRCQNSGSRFAPQFDHFHPRAFGGTHAPENLRMLCRNCNQRAAIEKLGLAKAKSWIQPSLTGRRESK